MENLSPLVKFLMAQQTWTSGGSCYWCMMAASSFEDASTARTGKLMKGKKSRAKCWRTTCCDPYELLELPGQWPKHTAILRFQKFSVLAWPSRTQGLLQVRICKMTFENCTQTVSTETDGAGEQTTLKSKHLTINFR